MVDERVMRLKKLKGLKSLKSLNFQGTSGSKLFTAGEGRRGQLSTGGVASPLVAAMATG
jgi:hypothetical protein